MACDTGVKAREEKIANEVSQIDNNTEVKKGKK